MAGGKGRSSGPAWLFPLLLIVPALLCALLVTRGIGRDPFWLDEAWSVSIANRSIGGTLAVIWHREANMGLYYVLLNGWDRLGSSEGFVRSLSAIFAVASVPVTVILTRREFGLVAAAIAGFALACNAFLAIYALEARAYALIVFLAPLVFLLFVRAVDAGRPRDWIFYVIAAAAMVYAQMLSGLLLVAQFASLPLLSPSPEQRRQAIRALVALACLCLPLAAFVVLRNKGQADWIPATSLEGIKSIPADFVGSRALELAYGLLFVLAAARLVGELRSGRRGREIWIRGLVLLWVAAPPLLLIAISFAKPLLVTKYLIGVVPGLAVLAGATIADLRDLRIAAALTALLAAFTAANVLSRAQPPPKPEDLRAAAKVVVERERPGDGIAYAPVWSRVGFSYYLARLTPPGAPRLPDLSIAKDGSPIDVGDVLAREVSPAAVRRRMASRRRIWLVGNRPPTSDWHPVPDPVSAVAPSVLRGSFVRVHSWTFGQIRVRIYRRAGLP